MGNESLISTLANNETFFKEALQNVTPGIAEEIVFIAEKTPSGLTENIIILLDRSIDVLVSTGANHGWWKFWILIFAIMGFFSLIAAVGNKVFSSLGLIFKIFIVVPLVIIVAFVNKKKRKERLNQWGELKEELKKQHKKIPLWAWALWIAKIAIPILIVIGFLIWI